MAQLKPGDRVDCRIKSSSIVSPYRSYDEIRTFEIVAKDEMGYWLYVPHYIYLENMTVADKYHCKHLNINPKFMDENIIYIMGNMIFHVHKQRDGLKCVICGEFSSYAEPNQPDGAFICFSCRANPYH